MTKTFEEWWRPRMGQWRGEGMDMTKGIAHAAWDAARAEMVAEVPMASENQIYRVYVSGRDAPKRAHFTEASAIAEARRLAGQSDNIGRRAYWVREIGYVEARVEVEEVRLRPAEGETA